MDISHKAELFLMLWMERRTEEAMKVLPKVIGLQPGCNGLRVVTEIQKAYDIPPTVTTEIYAQWTDRDSPADALRLETLFRLWQAEQPATFEQYWQMTLFWYVEDTKMLQHVAPYLNKTKLAMLVDCNSIHTALEILEIPSRQISRMLVDRYYGISDEALKHEAEYYREVLNGTPSRR
jgi:hypothetical protein